MKQTIAKVLVGATAAIVWLTGFGFATTLGSTQQPAWVNVQGSDALTGSDSLITSIKTFINKVLELLATIALVILLWGGFQMVTAAGDETKYKKGFQILKQAAIGLIFIGLSALFIQLIFYILGVVGA